MSQRANLALGGAMPLEQVRGCLESLNQAGQSVRLSGYAPHLIPCCMISNMRWYKDEDIYQEFGLL
jgi:hypothetical protein